MSHFTVLVIGDNVMDQLEPFQEYDFENVAEKYLTFDDRTEEVIKDWNNSSEEFKKSFSDIEDCVRKFHGYKIVDGRYGQMHNPNGKWDWYEIGGRWSGFFNLKNSAKSDQAHKKDIDFEGMERDVELQATKTFDELEKIVDWSEGAPRTWSSVREEYKDNIDAGREFYNNQKVVKSINENKKLRTSICCVERYFLHTESPRENFINAEKSSVFSTYAIIKDGEWISKGDMGWFGVSSNDIDQSEWDLKVKEMLQQLPDDTLLTLVDCHI